MEDGIGAKGSVVMFILGVIVIAVAAVWQSGVYRHWRTYRATILYMVLCNLFYYFLVKERLLWKYTPDYAFNHSASELLVTFIVFPCTVMLFLRGMAITTGVRRWMHLAKWIAIYLIAEWLGMLFGVIEYEHGWHYFWSVFFVFTMFPMIMLHHAKPLIAYALSVALIVFYLLMFGIPFPPPY